MFLGATWAKQKYKLKHTTDSSAVSVVVYYSLVFLGDLGKEKISTKAQHSALTLLLGGLIFWMELIFLMGLGIIFG